MEPKDEIKQRLDVVDIVGEYLTLKNAGSGSFKTLCPFHGEKSASFYVSREKQIWHCFGCDKGGDLISFVMEMEGMNFPEALRHLGKKAGVEIPEFHAQKGSQEKEFLVGLNELAGKYFEAVLWKHEEGGVAKKYLNERGIAIELAKKFRLGFAADRWDALTKFLSQKGYDEKRQINAGLVKRRNSGDGVIDRFRGRVMIPLTNYSGRIVGFTGRSLVEDKEKSGPKYLNSPETKIYHKSDVLFGLDLAKTSIRKKKSVIVVEGNLDVVASHKAGIEHVVASSGTALTESQLLQLKKLTSNLIFAFDADAAGFNAARRGIHLAQKIGFDIQVISIPEEVGKDPDDVVQKNPNKWIEAVENPIHIMEYYFQKSVSEYDISDLKAKRELAKFLCEEIGRIKDVIEREHWLQRLSDVIHVEVDVLRTLLSKSNNSQHSVASSQSRGNNPSASANTSPKKSKITSKVDQTYSFLIGLLLMDATFIDQIPENLFVSDPWQRIYKNIKLIYTQKQIDHSAQQNQFSQIRSHFQTRGLEDDIKYIDQVAMRTEQMIDGLSSEHVRDEMSRHLALLSSASKERERKQLESAIRQAERRGDSERLRALMEEYSKLLQGS
jgi:DNA primase